MSNRFHYFYGRTMSNDWLLLSTLFCFVLFPSTFQYTCVQAAYTLYDKMSAWYVYIVGKLPLCASVEIVVS